MQVNLCMRCYFFRVSLLKSYGESKKHGAKEDEKSHFMDEDIGVWKGKVICLGRVL